MPYNHTTWPLSIFYIKKIHRLGSGSLQTDHLIGTSAYAPQCPMITYTGMGTIVTYVQKESVPVGDETDEDEDNNSIESSKGPSNADAFSALETAVEWYKKQSECCPTLLLLLKRIRYLTTKKRGVQ
ncbi:uncharacterized protein TNCV_2002031 [Trichonephila clavipes]|nr:uncharacterized protein TNCV_2002031 [Trichonephila clavipes]